MNWNAVEIKFGKHVLAWSDTDQPLPLAEFGGCEPRQGWFCVQENCNGTNHYYVRG